MGHSGQGLVHLVTSSSTTIRLVRTSRSALSGTASWLRRYWALTNSAVGLALGAYLWQFLSTNQDFTGPLAVSLPAGLALTFLVGPLLVWGIQLLSALVLKRSSGLSFPHCLQQDALSMLPLGMLGLSPLLALLIGWHSTRYQAAVVVLLSLPVSLVAALKVWDLPRGSGRHRCLGDKGSPIVVGTAMGLFAVIHGALVMLRYNAHSVWDVDLGLVDQALWNTLHGRFMEFTHYSNGGIQMSHFAFHFEPILMLFVPVYAIWPEPQILLLAQTALVALGAWPLYLLARDRLANTSAATCVALAYLAFPAVVSAGLCESGGLRSDALAIPALLFALYYLERRNRKGFLVAVLVALACKETVALVVVPLGFYVWWRTRDAKLGMVTSGLGLAWFVVVVSLLIPNLRGGEEYLYYEQLYGDIGGNGGFTGILLAMISEPRRILSLLLTPSALMFLFFYVFSMGLFPILAPASMTVAGPIFAVNFLAFGQLPIGLGDHHYFMAIPLVSVSAVEGIRWLLERLTGSPDRPGRAAARTLQERLTVSASACMLAGSLMAGLFWSPGPLSWSFWSPGRPYTYWRDKHVADDHDRRTDRFVSLVPSEEPVIVSDYIKSRLTHRAEIYTFHYHGQPVDIGASAINYALVDLFENHARTVEHRTREIELQRRLLEEFSLTAFEDGLLLLERFGQNGFYTAVDIVTTAETQHRLDVGFGDRVELLGYDLAASPTGMRRGQRYRIAYDWRLLEGFDQPFSVQHGVNPDNIELLGDDWVLVDTWSQGTVHFRVVHLPTYLLMRPEQWQPGNIIREEFDFWLPEDLPPGEYEWSVGLYMVPSWFGIETDANHLVPGTDSLVLGRPVVQP